VTSGIARCTVRTAVEPVDSSATAQVVKACSADQPVVPRPPVELIDPVATDQNIIAGAAG
jgi:hypothetical protein